MKRARHHTFFLAFAISLFVLLTSAGCLVVDYQGRRLSFGEDQPPLQVRRLPGGRSALEVDLFGLEASLDFTAAGRAWDFLLDFLCLPHA